jgi:hypothetical protein
LKPFFIFPFFQQMNRKALMLAGLIWLQAIAGSAAAQEGVTVRVVLLEAERPAEPHSIAAVEIETAFTIAVVAENVAAPGVFGSQFTLSYDPAQVQFLEGQVQPGAALEPALPALLELDQAAGRVRYAVSRRGDVDNLTGSVALATLSFKAKAATAGQPTFISLSEVKLGAKGGLAVPVGQVAGLGLTIQAGRPAAAGDITGQVMVEGQSAGQWAGIEVTAVADTGERWTAATDSQGNFIIRGAPAGSYRVQASRTGFLAATCDLTNHSGETIRLEAVQLLAGDIDGNGLIEVADAVAIGAAFGPAAAGEMADLNGLDGVNILDLILMAANFGRIGEQQPWACQEASAG